MCLTELLFSDLQGIPPTQGAPLRVFALFHQAHTWLQNKYSYNNMSWLLVEYWTMEADFSDINKYGILSHCPQT